MPPVIDRHRVQELMQRGAQLVEVLGPKDYEAEHLPGDWFAAGLPREGAEAHVRRVADVVERDVPTCGLHERVGDLQDRVRAASRDVCVVVDAERIVLGIVAAEALSGDPATVVESIMKPDPVTFRPHLRTGERPDDVRKRQVRHALVTTSDGVLIGLLPDA